MTPTKKWVGSTVFTVWKKLLGKSDLQKKGPERWQVCDRRLVGAWAPSLIPWNVFCSSWWVGAISRANLACLRFEPFQRLPCSNYFWLPQYPSLWTHRTWTLAHLKGESIWKSQSPIFYISFTGFMWTEPLGNQVPGQFPPMRWFLELISQDFSSLHLIQPGWRHFVPNFSGNSLRQQLHLCKQPWCQPVQLLYFQQVGQGVQAGQGGALWEGLQGGRDGDLRQAQPGWIRSYCCWWLVFLLGSLAGLL